ncbi:hypothetical protein [Amycolatopsis sp. CA-230715]|uniref:hypothetical protein n=1 Tax=Amycolatopsis sp. CA-230715 TaxID=2745196 RepID=UPI001C326EA2|nr:hypothetical protein [Amycolatopsis sp. CA-230715]QWF85798.1 hypothetical protein HUW46_09278 [Amycolatopsis sp. CA-230715]
MTTQFISEHAFGPGYLRTSPIQRIFRDAQAGGLMAYSVEVCKDRIGREVLGA